MAGLVPAIHVLLAAVKKDVDARDIGERSDAVLRTAMHDDGEASMTTERLSRGEYKVYCSGVSPPVFFLASSISVTATSISARALRFGASSSACFSADP